MRYGVLLHMRKNTHQFRTNTAAYRHFSKPTYPTTREVVVTALRSNPKSIGIAAMTVLVFAAWFLMLWSL
jgi:hypothetical protein